MHSIVDGNPGVIILPMIGEASFPTNARESVKEQSSSRCIIRLGAPGMIAGFDVDTSHFNGAPVARIKSISGHLRNEI